ncbi:hypothetical protein TanjilG_01602 [Lupinus angustifolius]|nr:hypothetical protein TanjilG_01602 [Lupinus angustifolius]
MEKGPRYKAYSELRETRLRIRHQQQVEEEKPKFITTPPRKQVKFQGNLVSMRKGSSSSSYSSSILAQSVPDFTAALRKENKKPVTNTNNNTLLPSLMEMTPPMKSFSNNNNGLLLSGSRGSKSANATREKKKGSILMARKSYASVEELKSFSSATNNAINGESRGGRNRVVMGKSVSGYYRQF